MQAVSIAAAAIALDVSKKTIRRLIASGRLPAYRVGRQVRINAEDLTAVMRPVVTSGETGDAA